MKRIITALGVAATLALGVAALANSSGVLAREAELRNGLDNPTPSATATVTAEPTVTLPAATAQPAAPTAQPAAPSTATATASASPRAAQPTASATARPAATATASASPDDRGRGHGSDDPTPHQ